MQKDFMAMAQQQGVNPQQPPTPGAEQQFNPQDIGPTMEQMGAAGLPTGGSSKEIKQRILAMLQQTGLLEMFKTPAEKQKLAKDMDALVEAMESEDIEAIQSNPIIKLLEQAIPGEEEQPQQQQQAGPKNFAGMMPPGGGMGGR